MKELNIKGLIAKVPIIQGGMAVGISKNRLASAVANAGGIGVIATAGIAHLADDARANFVEANNRVFAGRKETSAQNLSLSFLPRRL